MGYRSEVVYRIVFDNEEVMKLFIAEARTKQETKLVFEEYEKYKDSEPDYIIQILEPELEIRFHGSDTKWYDSYEVVQAHMAMLDLARDYSNREVVDGDVDVDGMEIEKYREAGDVRWAFARIGEEMGDIEVWGHDDYYELLDVDRRIVY